MTPESLKTATRKLGALMVLWILSKASFIDSLHGHIMQLSSFTMAERPNDEHPRLDRIRRKSKMLRVDELYRFRESFLMGFLRQPIKIP